METLAICPPHQSTPFLDASFKSCAKFFLVRWCLSLEFSSCAAGCWMHCHFFGWSICFPGVSNFGGGLGFICPMLNVDISRPAQLEVKYCLPPPNCPGNQHLASRPEGGGQPKQQQFWDPFFSGAFDTAVRLTPGPWGGLRAGTRADGGVGEHEAVAALALQRKEGQTGRRNIRNVTKQMEQNPQVQGRICGDVRMLVDVGCRVSNP